jgi:hypothetical protein
MQTYAVLISILKYCFIFELFEKLRSALPPPPVARLIWATHLGVLATQLGVSPRVKAPNPDATQGGWVAWVPSGGLSPKQKELVFCLVLLWPVDDIFSY